MKRFLLNLFCLRKERCRSLAPGVLVAAVLLLLCACASIGNPSGGPRDEDPPRFIGASPAAGSTDVMPKRIVINFNELVNVKDAFSKVILSPSGSGTPRVSTSGRSVIVNFIDSLLPETTYTIDFSDAIVDNNEGNSIEGFAYTFSTGPTLDSLRISGMVLGARDLEAQQGVIVGAYPATAGDSAFTKQKLTYITKTDDRGRFILRGLKAEPYSLFALKDLDNDLKYANPEEDLAFYSVPITPYAERIMVNDTVFDLKTGVVDTVLKRERTLFLPNDILLRSFNTGRKTQYLVKYERKDTTRLELIFNDRLPEAPRLTLRGLPGAENELTIEKSVGNDTLTYWLPKRLVSVDSLKVAVDFLKPDSAANMVWTSDTLDFFVSRNIIKSRVSAAKELKKKLSDKSKVQTGDSVPDVPHIDLNLTAPSDIYSVMEMELPSPPAMIDSTKFRLSVKSDTIWIPFKGDVKIERVDTLNPRKWKIAFKRDFGATYQLEIDSLAVTDIYGVQSNPVKREVTVKQENDYSQLSFAVTGYPDTIPAFIEVLSQSEGVVRSGVVKNGKVVFDYLDPGTYYARITLDENGNGKFDTGDYETLLQPDEVFFFPGKISLKKNFDRLFEWDVFATAVDLQKPDRLKKNKPKKNVGSSSYGDEEEDEDDVFDPTRNPFDPNDRGRRNSNNNVRNNNRRGQGGLMNRPM